LVSNPKRRKRRPIFKKNFSKGCLEVHLQVLQAQPTPLCMQLLTLQYVRYKYKSDSQKSHYYYYFRAPDRHFSLTHSLTHSLIFKFIYSYDDFTNIDLKFVMANSNSTRGEISQCSIAMMFSSDAIDNPLKKINSHSVFPQDSLTQKKKGFCRSLLYCDMDFLRKMDCPSDGVPLTFKSQVVVSLNEGLYFEFY